MTTPAKPFDFEQALKELEGITAWFESSDTDLDAGLVKFERGMELATELKTHLTEVENRIEKIKHRFANPPAASAQTAAAEGPEAEAAQSAPPPGTEAADQAGLFGA